MKKLSNVKLKTLLIFTRIFLKEELLLHKNISSIGIATLAGYLNYLGYKNYQVVDLNSKPEIVPFSKIDNTLFLEEAILFAFNYKIKIDKTFLKKIKRVFESSFKADLICFAISHQGQFIESLILARIFKLINKNVFIVFGGPRLTRITGKLCDLSSTTTKMIDGIVVGDGEEPLAKLIYNLENNLSLKNVPNFLHKDGGSFKKTNNKFEITKKHLAIMPNFDGLELSCLPIRVSKGCYWNKCTFCDFTKKNSQNYIIVKPELIVKNIKLLVNKYSINKFIFVDDAIPPMFLKRFSEILLEKKMDIEWSCFFSCLDKKYLENNIIQKMSESGCKRISFGLESMSARVLKLMGKMHNPSEAVKIIKAFRKFGIFILLYTMFGFPTETKEGAEKTFNFLASNKVLYDKIMLSSFVLVDNVFPNKLKKKLLISIDANQKAIMKRDCLATVRYYNRGKGMSKEELKDVFRKSKKLLKEKIARPFLLSELHYKEVILSSDNRTKKRRI